MSGRWAGGATTKMRSTGTISRTRSTVSWRSVRSAMRSRNCLGRSRRDRGQSLVPAPPERTRTESLGNSGRALEPEVVEAHRRAYFVQRLARLLPGALAALEDDPIDRLRVRRIARATLADRAQEFFDGRHQLSLYFDVPDLAFAVTALEVVDFGLVVVENVMECENGVPLHPTWGRRAHAVGVRVHAHDLLLDRLRIVGEEYRVADALAHLSSTVDAWKHSAFGDERFGDREHRPEELVEASSDLARELDMRLLIAADRNQVALDHEDVGCLEDRIPQKAVAGLRDVVLAHLVLQRGYPLRPRDGHQPGEDEEELSNLR